MRKNFLLLLWLTLLPLAGWAQTAPTLASSPITWDGNEHQLITTAAGLPSGYTSTYNPTGTYWTGGGSYGWDRHYDDPAGIQYYVQSSSDPTPQDGEYSSYAAWYADYHYLNWSEDNISGITYDASSIKASAVGTYTIWYRLMRDHAGSTGNYQTGKWINAGTVKIEKPAISDMPYYISGPQRKANLVYNDGDQELITAGTEFCAGYNQSVGSVKYVVKTDHALPTPSEEAAAVTDITKVTGKDAGTYYVYYKIMKDNAYYTVDGLWSEVGVGGIKIDKRKISADDFTVTYAEDLTFKGVNQSFVTGLTWTGGIDRTATLAPNGKVEYSVQYEEGTPVTAATAEGLHAGAYKVVVEITGDANHYDFATEAKELTIKKATYTVKDPTIGTFTYNGTKQGPMAAGAPNIVVVSLAGAPGSPWYADSKRIEYSMTKNDGSWTVNPKHENLQRTDAGTYKIYYRTKEATAENADFEPVEGELEFTIDQAEWTVAEGALTPDWKYDSYDHSLAAATTAEGVLSTEVGVVSYYINEGEAIEYDALKAKNVGEYEVFYSVAETKNYKPVAKKTLGTVKVTQKDLHVVAQSQEVFYGFDKETGFDADAFMASLKKCDPAEIADNDDMADVLAEMIGFATIDGGKVEENKITEWPEDAATYDFTLKDLETAKSNYHLVDFMPGGKLTINQADNVWTAKVSITPDEWNYGEDPSEPTATPKFGDAKDVTYTFFDAEGNEYTGAIDKTMPAGSYTVKASLKGNANYKDLETADADAVPFTIKPINKTWTSGPDVADDGWIYREGPSAITAVASDGADVTFTYFDKDKNAITPATGETVEEFLRELTVGTYYVVATAEATNNYNELVSDYVPFTVSPAVLPTLAFTYDPVIYNAENQKPTDASIISAITAEYPNIKPANYVITFTDAEGNKVEEFKNVGTYKVVITGYWNYGAEVEGVANFQEKEFVINAAVATVTAPTAKKDLVYNNKPLVLIEAATSTSEEGEAGGTITYRLSDEDEWLEAIPTAINAGTYNVQWQFTADGNHSKDTKGVVPVTINKVNLSYVLGNTEKVWNGETFTDEQLKKAYTLTAGSLQGDDISEIPFTITMPVDEDNKYTDAGEYTLAELAVVPAEPTNYNVNFTGTAQLTIKKADLEEGTDFDAPTATPSTFDGSDAQLVEAGTVNKETNYATGFKYATVLKGEDEPDASAYTAELPSESAAGTYNVWYIVEGDKNHNNTDPAMIEVTIAQASLADAMLDDVYYDKEKKEYKVVKSTYDTTVQVFPTTLDLDAEDYDVELSYSGAYVPEEGEELAIQHAGTYTYTFTGKRNFTGTLAVNIEILKADLIATAPNAVKTYDATTTIEASEYGKPMFTGLLSPDHFDFGEGKTIADFVIIPEDAIDVNDYELTLDELPEQVDYAIIDYKPGTLTINKAAAVKIGFKKDVKYSAEYGSVDDEEGLEIVPGDLQAIDDTEFFGDFAAIKDQLTISRAEGHIVGNYPITLAVTDDAEFVNNYEGVSFDESGIFTITPFEAEIKLSIASANRTYNGEDPDLTWADDLSNMIVVGAPVDAKDEIFVEGMLPTITILNPDSEVGEYNIQLDGGTSNNYKKITFLKGSYFTIDPFMVKGIWNNKPVAEVGDAAADVMAKVDWDIEPADEDDDAEFLAAHKDQFEVQFATGVVDKNGKIAVEDGTDALVLVYKGGDANFEVAEEETNDLNIGGTDDNAIALNDSKPVETVATLGTTSITFTESRAVNADEWIACVLPCTVSIEDLSDAFGYAAVDLFDKSRTNATEIHFSLQVTGNIEAGTPFLFKANNNTNFNKVTIENATLASTSELNPVVEDDDTDIKFIGTFEGVNLTTAGFRYLSKGSWYATKDGQAKPYVIKPLRAYLDLGNDFTGARIFIEEPDGTVTAIDTITLEDNNAEGLYNLSGMKVNQGLKGVYIQNGKKVIKK